MTKAHFEKFSIAQKKTVFFEQLKRWGSWGMKSGLAILDQIIFSGANFLSNILLARWLFPEAYGAYAISFSILMLFYQMHFSFFLEPMSVIGYSHYRDSLVDYLKGQITLHFLISVPIGILLTILSLILMSIDFQNSLKLIFSITATMGVALPFLLLPWLLRRIFYILGKTWVSMIGSLLYAFNLVVLLFLYFKYETLTPIVSVWVTAIAGIGSAIFMIYFLGGKYNGYFHIPLRNILSSNWKFGKWLVIASFLMILAGQLPLFISGFMLSLDEVGAIRALQVVSQPMILSITAVSALAVPFLTADISSGKKPSFFIKTQMLTFGLVLLSLLFELILILFKFPIEHVLYNGKFANFVNLIPIWGILPVISAINSGFTSSLQASQKPYALLIASLIWLPASLLLSYLFIFWWGVYGASLSAVASFLIYVAVIALLYWKWILSPQCITKIDG